MSRIMNLYGDDEGNPMKKYIYFCDICEGDLKDEDLLTLTGTIKLSDGTVWMRGTKHVHVSCLRMAMSKLEKPIKSDKK